MSRHTRPHTTKTTQRDDRLDDPNDETDEKVAAFLDEKQARTVPSAAIEGQDDLLAPAATEVSDDRRAARDKRPPTGPRKRRCHPNGNRTHPAMALVEKSGLDAAEVSALTGLCIDDLATPDRELDEAHRATRRRRPPHKSVGHLDGVESLAEQGKEGRPSSAREWVSEHDKGVSMT